MKIFRTFILISAIALGLILPAGVKAQSGRFKVQNGQILDPSGKTFIVKGVTAAYGAFSGGDVNNYGTLKRSYDSDMQTIANLGVNLVRIMAAVPGSSYYSSGYASYYGSESAYKSELDKIVKLVRSKGMIAFIVPHHPPYDQSTVNFVSYLASTYKIDPYIWVGTSNEPDTCSNTACWQNWYTWHDKYVRAIRASGNQNPIIVNGVYWSGRVDKILQFPLHDNNGNVDTNLIYGPHKYGNDSTNFWQQDLNDVEQNRTGISDLSGNNYAVIVDEFGNDNGGKGNIGWLSQFTDYLAEWTNGIGTHQEGGNSYTHSVGGDGVIAFTWRWSDGNKLTSNGTDLTQWGNIFVNQYLKKVGSNSPLPTQVNQSPAPTSPQFTPAISGSQKSADANNDGNVDGVDYVIWLNNYSKNVTGGKSSGDFDGNGFVDGVDYVLWLNNYGK